MPGPIYAAAQAHPDQPAVITPGGTWTYAALAQRVAGVVGALKRRGTAPGDRVATYAPRTLDHLVVLMAALHSGAVIAPLSTRLPPGEVADRLAQINARRLVTDDPEVQRRAPESVSCHPLDALRSVDAAEAPPANSPDGTRDRPATIIFTSGSTGTPKAALHTLGNHYMNAKGAQANIALGPGDRWLLSLPLYHVGGLAILFRCWWTGACVVVPEDDEPLYASIAAHHVTHVSLVATQLRRLLQADHSFDTLRAILVGGGPLPAGLLTEAHARGWPVHTTYGCTEMASQVTTTPPGASREALATAGRVLPHRELCISDTGEILVRGPTLFRGYVDRERVRDPRDADGWYHTADRGLLDEDGYLHVHGRTDHRFISGGENIHPEEIERVLTQLPGVARAVVVPIPDDEFGARPVAFLEAREGEAVSADRLVPLLEARLPRFKIPVRFFAWPKDAGDRSMKIDRPAFRARAERLCAAA